METKKASPGGGLIIGGPCRVRTDDLLIKSQLLLPAELRARELHLVECMARPEGFEPSTNRFEVCDSIQLSYGRLFLSGQPPWQREKIRQSPQEKLAFLSILLSLVRQGLFQIFFRDARPKFRLQVARDGMPVAPVVERGGHGLADIHAVWAPGMEGAPGRRVRRAGYPAPQQYPFFSIGGIGYGDGGEERLRVGMQGCAVQGFPVREFHDLSQVHDRDPVADTVSYTHLTLPTNREV